MSGSIDRKKSQKGFLKEKVLQIYDKLFQGQDITQGRAEFWDDFFLLKVNLKSLTSHFEKLTSDELVRLKPQLNRLLLQCLHTAQKEKHRIRVANAIQTMDALVSGVYRCKSSAEAPEDMSELLLTPEQTKDFMQNYVSLCLDTFREDRPERLRGLIVNSMRTFATASPHFQTNPFTTGLMDTRIFDLLRLSLVNAQLRYHHSVAACKLLGLLMQYGSEKIGYPFTQQFCMSDDELLLNGVSSTISLVLSEYNFRFRQQHDPSVGFVSSVSSFLGALFVGDMASNVSLRPCDSLVMCMYAITKNSAHFSTLLSYSNAPYTENSAFDNLSGTSSLRDEKLLGAFSTDSAVGLPHINGCTPGRAVPASDVPDYSEHPLESLHTSATDVSVHINGGGAGLAVSVGEEGDYDESAVSNGGGVGVANKERIILPIPVSTTDQEPSQEELDEAALKATLEPRNLLAHLLEYCSIVMQDVKTPESLNSCQLCLIVVLCMTQNPMACSVIHDPHVTFKAWIHKQRSRYRKSGPNACANFSSRPIAIAVLSLIVEFIRTHLMKKLPARLYFIALAICHNLLCYQSKHKIRLDFDWKQLWSALLSLLQFVVKLDSNSLPLVVGFKMMHQILKIMNLCILYGDNFLQAADVYDDLYYELIRMRQLFENVYEHGLTHSTGSSVDVKQVASKVVLQLGNIRSIVNHFNVKIDAFCAENNLTLVSESQVLSIVRENYDSLSLRLHENLDIPEPYVEKDDEPLFETLLDTVLKQTRRECFEWSLQMQNYFQELSSIN
ncbi:unnamed protein product [Calicophoron daubneyi]|uniref:Armadillo-like helical domain-containing protein n=1 Tax=Calicophoron daubneyi TaxID=300641 RepID=A0AAV2TNP7_CALDB